MGQLGVRAVKDEIRPVWLVFRCDRPVVPTRYESVGLKIG